VRGGRWSGWSVGRERVSSVRGGCGQNFSNSGGCGAGLKIAGAGGSGHKISTRAGIWFPPHVTLCDETKVQFGCRDFETAPEVWDH